MRERKGCPGRLGLLAAFALLAAPRLAAADCLRVESTLSPAATQSLQQRLIARGITLDASCARAVAVGTNAEGAIRMDFVDELGRQRSQDVWSLDNVVAFVEAWSSVVVPSNAPALTPGPRAQAAPGARAPALTPGPRRSRTPWIVAGSGAAAFLAGYAVFQLSNTHMTEFNSDVRNRCDGGCDQDEIATSTWDLRDRADAERLIGRGLMIAGGAAVATGLIMLATRSERSTPPVAIAPIEGGAQIAFSGSFQ